MSKQIEIKGGDFAVTLDAGGWSLQAPDLVGRVIDHDLEPGTGRAARSAFSDRLDAAFLDADISYRKLLEIEVQRDGMAQRTTGGRTGSLVAKTRQGEPAIILRVPAVRQGRECVVLHTDEAGSSRWIWPQGRRTADPTRGGEELVFHLPRPSARPAPAHEPIRQRGELTKLGRRIVRVLYWATDRLVGAGAQSVARHWESRSRPYGFRKFPEMTAGEDRWSELAKGRALLLLHGTFSRAAAAFGELPESGRAALIRHYGGRIFAFDHPSLYHSPRENADQFYEMLPATANLELDVVTHSRGGLVARELIERQRDNSTRGPQVLIGKAVFISAPHVGTKLADGNHTTSLLDAYTNLLTELPDDAFSFTIEGVLALVKIAAHGALAGLPGLNCMLPTGDYLKGLNIDSRYQTKYYAAAADFKPQGAGLAGRFAAFVKGGFFFSIFGEENDGVVPTRGCYDGVPQLGSFPVPAERRLMFGPEDNVHHCNIVAHPELSNHLIKWLLS